MEESGRTETGWALRAGRSPARAGSSRTARTSSGTPGQDRPAGDGAGFFSRCLAKSRSQDSGQRQRWEEQLRAEVRSRSEAQGGMSVVRMCRLVQLSRASFYRHGEEATAGQEETELRDAIQREY